jgi:hypothetical protein
VFGQMQSASEAAILFQHKFYDNVEFLPPQKSRQIEVMPEIMLQ